MKTLNKFHKICVVFQCVKNLADFFGGSCLPGVDKPENNPKGTLITIYENAH